ncbi:M56 family metallopeptidase [Flavobacterium limnophilum]|uniref:M56 family metallopeptidase n=1 Tax=Flavobacterium limnophilum TaxID=3003262 RepID=UPI002482BC89|nr:M56 family metallopeptidase [Flavobacterium limnophilum]
MIDFLYKSSLSLFLLLIFYHLVLEKEKMHQFNRFYLLFSLVFSLAIPFMTIEIVTETIAPVQQTHDYVIQDSSNKIILEQSIDYKSIILWILYGLVASILLFRYIGNILKIISNIKSNPVVVYKNAKLVLLEEQVPPHTFLNYIFLNKGDYQNRKINEELYTHELIHVNEKHTLDILLVEALKTVLWFNPIFIFYKKAIQLNHEFLADEKVVTIYNNIPFYQNLLLAYANTNPTFGLTSNLNYSITKKRFIMMTKTVSKTRILLSKIVLLPLFSGLIFFICTESVAQVKTATNSNDKNNQIAENTDSVNFNASVKTAVGFFCIPGTYPLHEVDVKPEFPEGIDKLNNSIAENFIIPKDCLEVKLHIGFVVETDGSLSNFSPINDNCPGSSDEAIRVLKNLPKWKPGTKDGKAVRTSYDLPITILANK